MYVIIYLSISLAAHCLEPPRRRIPRNLFIVLGDHDWTQVTTFITT